MSRRGRAKPPELSHMSDALLQSILDEMKGLRSDLAGGKATTAKPADNKAAADKTAAAAKAAADKAAADKAAADKAAADKAAAAAKAAKPTPNAGSTAGTKTTPPGPPAGTKAPGGKYTVEQVREKVREVAANPNLGKTTAIDILDQDGGGVKSVRDLKPENYDKVYEACAVAIQTEGGKTQASAAPEDDLM
jgi:hypothetical protein